MPLTKARDPVLTVNNLSNGTTSITIPVVDSDLDINVGGVDAVDISSTQFTLGSALTMIAALFSGESISLATSGGASGRVRTQAGDMQVQSTTSHDLILGANSQSNLTCEVNGETTLGTTGTVGTSLVDKDYVDTQISAATGAANAATLAAEGTITFPTDQASDFIVKWGKVVSSGAGVTNVVTYATAFPNATLGVFMQNLNSGQGTMTNNVQVVNAPTAASFSYFHPAGSGSLNFNNFWVAIGH